MEFIVTLLIGVINVLYITLDTFNKLHQVFLISIILACILIVIVGEPRNLHTAGPQSSEGPGSPDPATASETAIQGDAYSRNVIGIFNITGGRPTLVDVDNIPDSYCDAYIRALIDIVVETETRKERWKELYSKFQLRVFQQHKIFEQMLDKQVRRDNTDLRARVEEAERELRRMRSANDKAGEKDNKERSFIVD